METENNLPAPITAPGLKLNLDLETINDRLQVFSTIPGVLQTITGKADRACMALSQITKIESDAEDTLANNLLVKVRVTYEEVEKMRKEVTIGMDDVKKIMMEPEKRISTDEKAASDYNRVKALRVAYAIKKQKDLKAAEAKAQVEKDRSNEIARIKAAMRQNVTDGVFNAITRMSDSVRTYVGEMTLENWDERMAKFNIQPKLKLDVYNGFFTVPYNSSLVTTEIYNAIVTEVQKDEPYDKINAIYVKQGLGVINMWKEDLPNKKAGLESIAATANGIDASVAKRALDEQEAKKANSILADANKAREESTKEINTELQMAEMKNEFTSQVATQGIADTSGIKGKRVAVLDCPDSELVDTLTHVLYACYTTEGFKGHYKLDKKGVPLPADDQGIPQYADWLSPLLNFIADKYDKDIPGIKWVEKIGVINKSPK